MAEEDMPVLTVKPEYSQRPQKSITLKPSIAGERPSAVSWTRPPGEILSGPVAEEPARQPSRPPPAKSPPRPVATQWTLRGISAETREEATRAAELEGMAVEEWVEQALQSVLYDEFPDEEYEDVTQEAYGEPEIQYEESQDAYTLAAQEEQAPQGDGQAGYAEPQEGYQPAGTQVEGDLTSVLQDIRDRLTALEQRKTFWDMISGLMDRS